jgi:SOS-response transcriptional repressor LexA
MKIKERYTVKPHSRAPIKLAHSLLSAGPAVEIDESFEQLDLNNLLTSGRDEGFVAFVVTGESMVETIPPGSIVVVDTYAEPRNGSIVVCCQDNLMNVKYFEQRSTGLFLVPANAALRPQKVEKEISIVGVVTGAVLLFRK